MIEVDVHLGVDVNDKDREKRVIEALRKALETVGEYSADVAVYLDGSGPGQDLSGLSHLAERHIGSGKGGFGSS